MKFLKKSKKNKSKKLILVSVLFAAILISGLIITFFTPVFSVKELRIAGINYSDNAYIHEKVKNGLYEENILFLSRKDIDMAVRGTIPEYKLQDVRKIPPNILEIKIVKRDSKYTVKSGNNIYVIDSEYLPIDIVTDTSDYNVIYDNEINLGEEITDSRLLAGIHYSKMGSIVKISGEEISIDLEGGGKVILPKDDAIQRSEELSNLLQKILQKYTIENRNISIIDLRYSKPLIKFN